MDWTCRYYHRVIGIALSFLFYYRVPRKKEPRYARRSIALIKDLKSKVEGLEVRYRGQAVENLVVTRLAFWNAGSQTLDADDIAPADPLRIEIGNGRVLHAKVIAQSNESNQFRIETQEKEIEIHFDYLDKSEGGAIQILHTSAPENVAFKGTIKGRTKVVKKAVFLPQRPLLPMPGSKKWSRRRHRVVAGTIVLSFPILFGAGVMISGLALHAKVDTSDYILMLLWFVLYVPFGLMILRRRVPRSLSAFEDDF